MTSIAIPLYPGVDVLDVAGPYEMLSWAGFDIDLLAEHKGPVPCRGGAPVFDVGKTFECVDRGKTQYDILWVPGGHQDALVAVMEQRPRKYLDFVIAQARGAKMVCSVCEGSILLAHAGLLDGYEATTHWMFANCYARWPKVKIAPCNPRYVRDRDRLTGGGISSGLDEALVLIELFMSADKAREVQQTTQYYPDPPVGSILPSAPVCPIPSLRPPAPS